MIDPFNLEARYYDKIWGLSDRYRAEAQSLNKILKEFRVVRVLDLACGTGGHCLELSKLGYDVVGLDISEMMLEKARKKISEADTHPHFILGDITQTYSILESANIPLPFDAIISMSSSLAHLTDDKSLIRTLEEGRKVLKEKGVFIFCVGNAEKIQDDLLNKLRMDTIVNEASLQIALLAYNFKDASNPDTLVWNSLWFINEHGKPDFQVRTHLLRWFRYGSLKTILENHGYTILQTYGDVLGQEQFDSNKHDTIFMVCQRK